MKHAHSSVIAALAAMSLLAACNTPTTAPTSAPQPESAATPVPPTPTPIPPTPTPEPTATQITIDGDPSDWAERPALLEDPVGDAEGGLLDFTTGYAFANQDAVYLLVEVVDPSASVTEFNFWFKADARALRLQWRLDWGEASVSEEMPDGSYTPLGPATCSQAAFGPALEIRVDLRDLESPEELLLESVTADVQESPDDPWRNADAWQPVTVPPLVNEVDPALPPREEAPAVPQVCAEVVPPVPFGSFPPAPLEFAQPGYAAEWFVAPGAFNMPQEVLITPQGDLLVQGVRNFALFRVADNGTVTPVAEHVFGYLGDVDAQGNVYLHFGPQGTISRISIDGAKTIVVESPKLQSSCICPLTVGPDGNLYVLISRCSDTADLYQVTPEGRLTHLAEIPQLEALRTVPDGRLLAARDHDVYELSLDDYSLTPLARVPGPGTVAVGGLAVDDSGNIYVSTINHGGQVYRIDLGGQVTLLAEIPTEGLTGIEWMSGTDEIVGGQWIQGSLVAVGPDGAVREIVSGSGLVTPMNLAFSPCGELAVPADEAGMMLLVNPAGEVSRLFEYLSYIPPLPFAAFGPDGTLYASESEPMPHTPKRIIVVPPGETLRTLVEADMPSGLARRADGVLLVAETGAGRITQVNPDGTTTILADELNYPQALALDTDGNLYVVIGPANFVPDGPSPVPAGGDAIMRISPEGDRTILAQVDFRTGFAAVAIGPEGDLFATMPDAVVRVSADGQVLPLASGFTCAIGLAFDLAGNLYVSDSEDNGIVRISGFPHGTLSGVVTDASNAPIAGARVQVLADGPIVVGQAAMTDGDGRFSLPAAPRTYTVIVTAEGYETTTLEGIEVTADQETVVEIEL